MQDKQLSYQIIGCAMKVHRHLGYGYQEVIYQRALEHEFQEAGIKFQREHSMDIWYKDRIIGTRRVDFFVEDSVMVELKAIRELTNGDKIQTNNYCRIYRLPFGMLLNFGGPSLEYHRIYNLDHPLNKAYRAKNGGQNNNVA